MNGNYQLLVIYFTGQRQLTVAMQKKAPIRLVPLSTTPVSLRRGVFGLINVLVTFANVQVKTASRWIRSSTNR